jgi:hypothetical protein
MQDTLSKVLINLASGSLQIVLVLYLVLYADMAGCFLQGDMRTKVKTPGAGKNESRRDCANFYHGEAVQAPLFPSPGSMHSLQQPTSVIYLCRIHDFPSNRRKHHPNTF